MQLGEKLKHLRQLEGELRGKGRPMSKAETLRAMKAELGQSVSHAYLCQLESGARTHMSPNTRALLARFFKVLPGYLVSDPEGYEETMLCEVATEPDQLRAWLGARAEEVRDDVFLYHILLRMSRHADPRELFRILDEALEKQALDPAPPGPASRRTA